MTRGNGIVSLVACCLVTMISSLSSQETNLDGADLGVTFLEFLRTNLPPDSALREDTAVARRELHRTDHLEYAIDLEFFPPWKLIKVILMDPAAGAPGRVMADARIVYNPQTGKFAMGTIEWINDFRDSSSLDVTNLEDDRLDSYIEELVTLVPMADRFGFAVSDLIREDGLFVRFSYEQPHDMSMLGELIGGLEETVTFNPQGGVIAFETMEVEYPFE